MPNTPDLKAVDLPNQHRADILRQVAAERHRQDILVADGKVPYDLAGPIDEGAKGTVLAAQAGRVPGMVISGEPRKALRYELIQTAALEYIDQQLELSGD
jgi:hypothetical protein